MIVATVEKMCHDVPMGQNQAVDDSGVGVFNSGT